MQACDRPVSSARVVCVIPVSAIARATPTQPTVSAAPSPKIRPVRAPSSMALSTCQGSLRYQMRS